MDLAEFRHMIGHSGPVRTAERLVLYTIIPESRAYLPEDPESRCSILVIRGIHVTGAAQVSALPSESA